MTNVFDLLVNSEKEYGNRVAIRDEEDVFTYSELLKKSLLIAVNIQAFLKHSNNLIFVVTTKSARSLLAIWGVIASGNYYACIDEKISPNRAKYLIDKMKPALIIDSSKEGLFEASTDLVQRVSLDDCLRNDRNVLNMVLPKMISTDPLYMVFTSGSTGYPKAIVKNHQSILSFAESFVAEFKLSDSDKEVFGNQASYDYDVSAKDIFLSVYLGGTLCVIPNKYFIAPAKLAQYIFDNGITILIWAASAVKFIEKFNCFGKCVPSSIKHVFFSGEPMPVKCMEYWSRVLPEADFYNLYAPSEVTGNCLYYKYSGMETTSYLPLEKTFRNSEVLFLTDSGEIAKNGQKGEAYVRGTFLAQGYYQDPKQTKERFIQNPLHNLFPDIVYKTGDYFTINGDKYLFSGRVDNQIKHMGHRIELEEIEAAILRYLGNADFCVVYDAESENIILLIQDKEMDFKSLLVGLKSFLPKYMLPYKAIAIDRIPLNARGKVDRAEAYKQYMHIKKIESRDY